MSLLSVWKVTTSRSTRSTASPPTYPTASYRENAGAKGEGENWGREGSKRRLHEPGTGSQQLYPLGLTVGTLQQAGWGWQGCGPGCSSYWVRFFCSPGHGGILRILFSREGIVKSIVPPSLF